MYHLGLPMYSSRLSSKGQVVVPKAVRDRLGLKPGDRIDFMFGADDTLRLAPANRSVQRLSGILYKSGRQAVTLEEMQKSIELGATSGEDGP